MDKKEYLYCASHYTKEVFRYEIVRKTAHNYWISRGNGETKISRKTLIIGERFNRKYFYEETPEWLQRYVDTCYNRVLEKSLDILKKASLKESHDAIIALADEVAKSELRATEKALSAGE